MAPVRRARPSIVSEGTSLTVTTASGSSATATVRTTAQVLPDAVPVRMVGSKYRCEYMVERDGEMQMCGEEYAKREGYRSHYKRHLLKAKQAQEDRPVCPSCQQSFAHSTIKLHVKTCGSEDAKPYKCSECTATYATPGGLNKHVSRGHGGGKKPYVRRLLRCTVKGCQKDSPTETARWQHMQEAHDPPHRCDVVGCGKGFWSQQVYVRHTEQWHGDEKVECGEEDCEVVSVGKFDAQQHDLIHDVEMKWKCNLERCKQPRFKTERELLQHSKTSTHMDKSKPRKILYRPVLSELKIDPSSAALPNGAKVWSVLTAHPEVKKLSKLPQSLCDSLEADVMDMDEDEAQVAGERGDDIVQSWLKGLGFKDEQGNCLLWPYKKAEGKMFVSAEILIGLVLSWEMPWIGTPIEAHQAFLSSTKLLQDNNADQESLLLEAADVSSWLTLTTAVKTLTTAQVETVEFEFMKVRRSWVETFGIDPIRFNNWWVMTGTNDHADLLQVILAVSVGLRLGLVQVIDQRPWAVYGVGCVSYISVSVAAKVFEKIVHVLRLRAPALIEPPKEEMTTLRKSAGNLPKTLENLAVEYRIEEEDLYAILLIDFNLQQEKKAEEPSALYKVWQTVVTRAFPGQDIKWAAERTRRYIFDMIKVANVEDDSRCRPWTEKEFLSLMRLAVYWGQDLGEKLSLRVAAFIVNIDTHADRTPGGVVTAFQNPRNFVAMDRARRTVMGEEGYAAAVAEGKIRFSDQPIDDAGVFLQQIDFTPADGSEE